MATSNENLTEIGLVFSEEGYDSLIDKVKKVGQEVERLTKEDEARVAAAAKVAKANDQLSAQIDRAIVGYAGSKSAIFEYKAAQLSANDAITQQIALLRELETHTAHQAEAFKGRQQDLKNQRGLQEDYNRDQVAASKALQAQQAEAAKMARGLEADRVKDIQLAVTAENKAREDANARYVKHIKESFKVYQDAKNDSIKVDENVMVALRKANTEAEKLAERQAIKEIEWANKSAKERIAILQQVQQYQNNPNISTQTVTNKFGEAAMRDLPQLSKMQADYAKEVNNTTAAHGKLAESQKTIKELWGEVTLGTSRVRSEMIVLAHEAVQGRFSRIPASLMVFAEYSNLSALAMTGLGVALLSAAGAVATLITFAVKGQLEFTRLNTAIIQTGGYSGMTTSSFYSMAKSMTEVHGRVGEAKEAMMLLAETGKFTKNQIETIAPAIIKMAHVSEQSVADLVKQFEKLADDPVRVAKELNSQYHFLTGSIYEQIAALERQGNKQAAVELSSKEFARASSERADQIKTQLGWFERGWDMVADAVSRATAAAKSLGRPDSILEQINATVKARDQELDAGGKDANRFGRSRAVDLEKVKEYNDKLFRLMRQAENEEETAAENSARAKDQEAAISGRTQMQQVKLQNLTPREKEMDREAKFLQSTSAANIGMLREAGLKTYEIAELTSRKILAVDATYEQIMKNEEDRSKKIVEFARQRGFKLAATEEEIARQRQNIRDKVKDGSNRPVKEVSFVETDKFVQDQEREFQKTKQQVDRMEAEINKRYTAAKRLADEELSVVRDNADTKSDIRLAEVAVYADYARKIKALNEQVVRDQEDALDKEIKAGEARTTAIVKQANAQKALTEDGRIRRKAIIDKAQDDQQALVDAREQKSLNIRAQSKGNIEDSEAQTYRQATADVNRLIDSANKRLAQREREYAAIGLTKTRVRELAELEEEQTAAKYKAAIAQEQMAMSNQDLSENEIRMYKERIAKLEELYTKTMRFAEINAALKARQSDWLAGMQEGFNNYMNSVDNVFDSSKKLTEQTFKDMGDALAGFVTTGKLNFSSLFSTLASGLAKLYIQSKVLGPIANALNGGSNGGGGGNSFVDGMLGSVGKFFGMGGGIGGASLGNVSSSAALGLMYADGGNPPINQPYLVGEEGPEWHIDRRPSTILPNGTNPTGMGQSITVVNNFTLHQPADQRTQDQVAVMAGLGIQRALARNT